MRCGVMYSDAFSLSSQWPFHLILVSALAISLLKTKLGLRDSLACSMFAM